MLALETRRKRFRAALVLAEMTLAQWAEAEGISRFHLHEVLAGRRVSPRLNDRIDEFTQEYLSKVAA